MSQDTTNDAYAKAAHRVHTTPELDEHDATILYDWPEGDEHWRWVATADIADIVEWAEAVEAEDIL